MKQLLGRLVECEAGSPAIEFALILPVIITLMVGSVCAANLFFAVNSLHFAVEDAARCASVKTMVCSSTATTIAYAQNRYAGPQISPSFAYSNSGCGHTVSATASYPIYLAAATIDVPISASACYP